MVGLKGDLRNDSNGMTRGMLVTAADAEAIREDIDAVCVVECSALTQDGLKNVFDEAIRTVLIKKENEFQT